MKKIVLFYPHVSKSQRSRVYKTLCTRWIGQGEQVDEFEQAFKKKFNIKQSCLAVNSGTSALHLAYILAGIKEGDEVITSVFTCSATNTPLLWMQAKPVFADCKKCTLNIDVNDVKRKITDKTKAIVYVNYGGMPCDIEMLQIIADKYNISLISDSAQALGGQYKNQYIGNHANYTCFSFQAIKHITTGDGGMLVLPDKQYEKAKRLRWFGIDREAKLKGIWENDIKDIGYKYQMTDISAAMGIEGLKEFDKTLAYRKKLFNRYYELLENADGIKLSGNNHSNKEHAAWLITAFVENRKRFIKKLNDAGVESGQVHYRNDQYTIFDGRQSMQNMDMVEDKYIVLPLHTKMSVKDVEYICKIIKGGW